MIDLKLIQKEIKPFFKDITFADIYQYLELLNVELQSRNYKTFNIDTPNFQIEEPYPNMFNLIICFLKSKLSMESIEKEIFFHNKFIQEILNLDRYIKVNGV